MVHSELERDGREKQNERQLKTILRLLPFDGERCKRHAADEKLRRATRTTTAYSYRVPYSGV